MHVDGHSTVQTRTSNSFICHTNGLFSLGLQHPERYLPKHVCIIKPTEHEAAICAQCDTRGKGSHAELTGASICTEDHNGNSLLMPGARRGQLDLIALREHVCWSKLAAPLCKGADHLPPGTFRA